MLIIKYKYIIIIIEILFNFYCFTKSINIFIYLDTIYKQVMVGVQYQMV